jgi:osmotically-inducible protein OsmY
MRSDPEIERSDPEIEEDVRAELEWQPGLDATDIAVSVRNGIVTLAGFVHHYNDKVTAEVAAKRVAGVVAVANDIEVREPTVDERPDPEIARDAVAAIKARLPTSWEGIKVIVKNGYLSLEGEVEWQYQRETAEAAVRWLQGVRGVTNFIGIKPRSAPEEIKRRIEEAFRRNAEIDAHRIGVEASGSEVVLKGQVRSWAEREEAERAAWAAPGVTKVDNRIVVSA